MESMTAYAKLLLRYTSSKHGLDLHLLGTLYNPSIRSLSAHPRH